jgi:hypothetical protein
VAQVQAVPEKAVLEPEAQVQEEQELAVLEPVAQVQVVPELVVLEPVAQVQAVPEPAAQAPLRKRSSSALSRVLSAAAVSSRSATWTRVQHRRSRSA